MLDKSSLACLLAVCFSLSAVANDAPLLNVGGHLTALTEGETTVRMESENVSFTLKNKGYETHASFVLVNSGDACKLTIGFPIFSTGNVGYLPFPEHLKHARARVNGKPVKLLQKPGWWSVTPGLQKQPGPLPIKKGEGDVGVEEMQWLTKEVRFPANGRVVTEISYSSEYDMWEIGEGWIHYFFGSGSGWQGNIGEMVFTVHQSRDRWISSAPNAGSITGEMCREPDGTVLIRYRDVEPDKMGTFSMFVGGLKAPWGGAYTDFAEWLESTEFLKQTGDWYKACALADHLDALRLNSTAASVGHAPDFAVWIRDRESARRAGTRLCIGVTPQDYRGGMHLYSPDNPPSKDQSR